MGNRRQQADASRKRFLEAFALNANVSAAAAAAGIDRSTPYKWQADDPEFKEAWEQAEQQAIDRLEAAAYARAVDGWEESHVNNRGELYSVRKFSDQLAITLLKAHRPTKYRERMEHSGPGGKEPVRFTLNIAPPPEAPE